VTHALTCDRLFSVGLPLFYGGDELSVSVALQSARCALDQASREGFSLERVVFVLSDHRNFGIAEDLMRSRFFC